MTQELVMDEVQKWFLVAFDREVGDTKVSIFDDQSSAFDAYIEAERDPRTKGRRPMVDVVLIGADSLQTVESTYAHFFQKGSRQERLRNAQTRFSEMLSLA